MYTDRESGNIYTGKIINRAGKVTGKNKTWFNLEFMEPDTVAGSKVSVDLSHMDNLQVLNTPSNFTEHVDERNYDVMIVKNVSFEDAKIAELDHVDSWKKNEVYERVEDNGQKCISSKWICTLKETKKGIIPKARLVARG